MKSKPNALFPASLSAAESARPSLLFHLALANRAMAETLLGIDGRYDAVDDDVLANIGHELRTPLTIIQGLSEILLDELDDGRLDASEHRDFMRQIHRASVALGKLVEMSIMLTKINAGHLTLHMQPLHVTEAIERVISQYSEEISAKNLHVELSAPSELPLVWADGFCLELALQALYDNAIKFNVQGGRICWQVSCEGETVQVAITDTGVGIPSEKLPELFAVFGQLESGPTRRYGGLGLGLPLVRKLLESLGGDIDAHSPGPNEGATFTCLLRLAPVLS